MLALKFDNEKFVDSEQKHSHKILALGGVKIYELVWFYRKSSGDLRGSPSLVTPREDKPLPGGTGNPNQSQEAHGCVSPAQEDLGSENASVRKTKGYMAKEAPLGRPYTPKGYNDKAAETSCARNRPKRTFPRETSEGN